MPAASAHAPTMPRGHRAFDDAEAFAGAAEHVAGAGPHAVEHDLARAQAVHRAVLAHVEAGGARVEGEHGEPAAVPGPAPGAGAHRDDVRRGGVEHDALGAGQPVAAALRLGPGLHVREPRSGTGARRRRTPPGARRPRAGRAGRSARLRSASAAPRPSPPSRGTARRRGPSRGPSITIAVSTGPPPTPPASSGMPSPSHPSSANLRQSSRLNPASPAARARRTSKETSAATSFSTLSRSRFCSSVNEKFMPPRPPPKSRAEPPAQPGCLTVLRREGVETPRWWAARTERR